MKQSMYEKACDYIDYKKGLGYQYQMGYYMLRSFGNYADIHAPGESFRIRNAGYFRNAGNEMMRLRFMEK